MTRRSIQVERRVAFATDRVLEIGTLLGLLAVTAALFWTLFNRENALSYSIGYNLYGAERVLDGETPYKDFHTLYPPAIVYLNAALFRSFGVSLYNALAGVLVLKILTTAVIYLAARRLLPRLWALAAVTFSLIWLRPNGPFKSVPMHYGAFFLALALLFFLRALGAGREQRGEEVEAIEAGKAVGNMVAMVAVGFALGLLALFKHNIGAYALIGTMAVFLIPASGAGRKLLAIRSLLIERRQLGSLLIGFALPIVPVIVYLWWKNALGAMIDTLLFGPGEFLLNRLAAVPSPLVPLTASLYLVLCGITARRLAAYSFLPPAIIAFALFSMCGFVLLAPQSLVDGLIFYAPVIILLVGVLVVFFAERFGISGQRREILAITMFAAAAFMEAFPRFAREQAVAAMPFIALLLLTLLYRLKDQLSALVRGKPGYQLLLVGLPVTLFLTGSRLFVQTYFDSRLLWRSDTELTIERGRGVYFPGDKAREIDATVVYVQSRIAAGGYVFPQSYGGSSYLFLADRNNPSGAQFWGGVGVREAERQATLAALDREEVQLVITSAKDLEAERYAPMREFLDRHFTLTREFGETLILERQ